MDMTAADHIEAVRLAPRMHGRSQLPSISWQDWQRTEPVNLAAHATTNQPAAHPLVIGVIWVIEDHRALWAI
jgi:hypothetical protein